MPLTEKGKLIKSKMQQEYGSKEKGDQVFYASQNKGTIEGTHKTSEVHSPQWLEGFTKSANDLGLTDPNQVVALLKMAQRLHFMQTHPDSFDAGYTAEMTKKGMTKEAIPWGAMKTLGLLGAGAAGMVGAQAAGRNMGIRPFNRQLWTVEDFQNAAKEYQDIAGRLRPHTSPFGMMGQQGMYGGPNRMGYFSPTGGYYTSPY